LKSQKVPTKCKRLKIILNGSDVISESSQMETLKKRTEIDNKEKENQELIGQLLFQPNITISAIKAHTIKR